MEITDLIKQAQQMGITVYPWDGQIKVDIPWQVNTIPDTARATLLELKKCKSEIMTYFALEGSDIKLLLATLRSQGVRVVPDPQTGMKIYITREAPNRCNGTAIKLINKLHDCKKSATEYLSAQAPEPG